MNNQDCWNKNESPVKILRSQCIQQSNISQSNNQIHTGGLSVAPPFSDTLFTTEGEVHTETETLHELPDREKNMEDDKILSNSSFHKKS